MIYSKGGVTWRKIIFPVVCAPDGCNDQAGLDKSKEPGASYGSPTRVSPSTLTISCCFHETWAGSKVGSREAHMECQHSRQWPYVLCHNIDHVNSQNCAFIAAFCFFKVTHTSHMEEFVQCHWTWLERRATERILSLLAHSPHGCSSHIWSSPKPGAGNPIGSPTWVGGAHVLVPLPVVFPGALAGSWIWTWAGRTQPGSLIRDPGIVSDPGPEAYERGRVLHEAWLCW